MQCFSGLLGDRQDIHDHHDNDDDDNDDEDDDDDDVNDSNDEDYEDVVSSSQVLENPAKKETAQHAALLGANETDAIEDRDEILLDLLNQRDSLLEVVGQFNHNHSIV